jgi:hypothetical protein
VLSVVHCARRYRSPHGSRSTRFEHIHHLLRHAPTNQPAITTRRSASQWFGADPGVSKGDNYLLIGRFRRFCAEFQTKRNRGLCGGIGSSVAANPTAIRATDGTIADTYTAIPRGTTPPTISNVGADRSSISKQGPSCTTSQRATVSASVTDAGDVNRVVARYSGAASGEVGMSPAGGNVYRGTVGPIANIGNLSILVVAWDNAGNVGQSSPFVVTVVNCIE